MIAHFNDDVQELFADYIDFISQRQVTSQNESLIEVLEMLLDSQEDDLALAQLCIDSLNESFMQFFEEMKMLGKINNFKEDYLY